MEPDDIQGKKFPGYGRCIYCGSTDGGDGLGDEHVIPFALGGNAEILAASCKWCERITSYLDGYLARHTYHEYRAHAGTQTRNPRERPPSFPARIVLRLAQLGPLVNPPIHAEPDVL
jgi:HNH endonuclease